MATEEREALALDVPVWDRTGDIVMKFAGGAEGTALVVRWRIAKAIAGSGMTRHSRPEAVLAIMLTCYEMGLPVMQGIRGMYFADGKIGIEGHLMDALAIERCGVTKAVQEQSMERCRLTLSRPGWQDLEVEFTMADAIRAGLVQKVDGDTVVSSKINWRKHPQEMLYWRTLSKGLKQIAPDYFGGVYSVEELQEQVDAQRKVDVSSTNEELDALEQLAEEAEQIAEEQEQSEEAAEEPAEEPPAEAAEGELPF